MCERVIRNALIVAGTGRPAHTGDLAVVGGRIAAVGIVEGGGEKEIDAAGRLLTPGWVDVHSHTDGQATWDPLCSPAANHGITTRVMGKLYELGDTGAHCGVLCAAQMPGHYGRERQRAPRVSHA